MHGLEILERLNLRAGGAAVVFAGPLAQRGRLKTAGTRGASPERGRMARFGMSPAES